MCLRSQFACMGLSLAIFALLSLDSRLLSDGGTSRRNPVPGAGAQAEAAKVAKEVYGDEYSAAKTPAEKRGLARKLLAKAGESENDLPGRYVLLRLSRDIATQADDVETAFLAVEQIGRSFDVNAVDLKREVLIKLAAAARTATEHKLVAEKCLAVIDQAVVSDDFQVVAQFGPMAVEECTKSGNQSFGRQVQQRLAEIETLSRNFEKVKSAKATLDKVPDDPEANLTVGSYLCFAKGRWEEGIPMLALGKDPALKALAAKELDGAQDAKVQVDLADQWRDLAEARPAEITKPMRARSLFWYRKSVPGLTGLMKSKAELRIRELAPAEVASVEVMPRSKTPTSNFPSGSTNADSGELRHWQTKSGDTAFEAELKQVERSTAILKKKEDGQIVKIAFDNLCDGDQEAVSDWTLRELNRIWENGTEKIGPRESCESVKAREMAKALDGACVHTVFSIDQAPSTEQEQTLTKLRLSGAWDSKLKEIVLPLSQSLSAKVSQDAQLVVLGRLNIKYAACPLCGGTGMLKCPDCVHGQRYHMESKPIVFPSGERVMQSVKVSVRCQTCGGSGRHGVCRQHDLQAWEPFGTRKLPQGSFFTLTDSGGARRVCIALDEPCIQIHVTANVITFRRAEGKLDIQTTAAGKIP